MTCGVDEAGRGPLAGPVAAAAVCLGPARDQLLAEGLLRDSKRLSALQRHAAATQIARHAVAWSVGWAWPQEIDRINIHCAALLAMARAVGGLGCAPSEVLVDGTFAPEIPYPVRTIVGGDNCVPEIMAASIMAKTARDRWMIDYSLIEPRYGFERHKGYPTRDHRLRIQEFGPCPIHRRSFRLLGPS